MNNPLSITFKNGQTALATKIDTAAELSSRLRQISLCSPRPVLVIVGGASKMSEESLKRLESLFTEVLAPVAEKLGAFVLDGGTDAGVMQMMGKARTQTNGTFPLVGIAPVGKVLIPDQDFFSSGEIELEPNHTHFLLIPGSTWGDESPWISQVATTLAGNAPSLTVLANGGEVSLVDVSESIKAERPLVILAGSGRLADEITRVVRYPEQQARERLLQLLQDGQLTLFDLTQPLAELTEIIRERLKVKKLV
ncbi:MAG: hypothetical protein WA919_03265 [Coleofasciculaceae cyanobacterium]